MEIVISIAAKIAEYTVAPIGQWLGYSFHYGSNIENMKNQVEELGLARDSVQHSVDTAIRNAEEIEAIVNSWLTKVDAIKGKAMEVLEDEEKAKMRSSNGACLNLKLRHQQSKKAKKIVKDIDEALRNGKFDKVSYRPASQGIVTTTYKDYMTFESRMSTIKELMDALQDANINMIGVWGMPGVGKTTLVRELAKQVIEEKLFDEVAIATVTHSPDLIKIQGEIADKLDLKLDKETLSGRADLLRARLTKDKNKKKEEIADKLDLKLDQETLCGRADLLRARSTKDKNKKIEEIADKLDLELDQETLCGRADLPRARSTKDKNKKIEEIADKLDLELDQETLCGRADLLRARSTKDKNKKIEDKNKGILVILDDIWEKLDLDEIGIPRQGCKVVVTSRDRDILSSQMDTEKDFGLNVLPKEEAWSLFEKFSGDSLKDSNLRSRAIEVSTACAGLPLALVTVAKALKNKSLIEWEDALQQLRRPSPRNQKRMQEVIYSAIKLSYNHLESPELRAFFLLCAQNQVGSSICYLDLLKKCFGLRLFHDISALEVARNRIYAHVRSLKDSSLLLDDPDTSQYFQMHDLARDVALLIAYETQNVLMMRDEGPVEWPEEDDIKMCTSISVLQRDIHELPDRLECPELRYLLVYARDRNHSFKISDTFFEGMRKLKVLDLTYMRLSSLPSSLDLLTNLQTLCLDQCVLGDITMIGKLENLKLLSLLKSEFKQLPREIGQLTHLRLLDLSNCSKLEVIPSNVLSRLIQLEELYVGNSFTQWEAEGLNNERASLAELKHLSQLTTLEVHIPDANMLPKDLLLEKLKRYKIFIGDVWDWADKHENSRALKLKLNTSIQLESGIKMLLNGIEDLCLDELKGVESIIYELDTEGFQQLKHLHVQNNVEIKYIINPRRLVIDDVVFPALEIVSLKNMINLEEICHGQLASTSFRNLRIVKVEHCEKLKFVFSSSIAKGLSQLQELEIRECNIMGAIVLKEEAEVEDRDMILLPQLRHLVLHRLPKLMSFLSTQKSVINVAGEIIPECDLDFHMPILLDQVVFPNLEKLKLCYTDSEEILQNQHRERSSFKLTNIQTKSRFQNLWYLKVKGSCSLKYLLSSSTARVMEQLKYLSIKDCKVMEEILLTEYLGEEEKIIPMVLFPRLTDLELKDLPVLKRFCIGSNIKFPSLKDMCIEQCPKLNTFIFKPVNSGIIVSKELKEMNSEEISLTTMQPLFNEEVSFPSLKALGISHMENLKIIWHNQLAEDSFSKLQELEVLFCENLMSIFHSNMLIRFQSLEKLIVQNCGSLQEIFELQGQDVRETQAVTAIPLKELNLYCLPKMKQVWNKDPQGIFSFPNLQVIYVWDCESLKSLFPASMARFLMQLKDLRVDHCGVEEIVAQEYGAEAAARLVFPKVTFLLLSKLPKLKWFYQGVHTSEWPLLKHLEVYGCDQIEICPSKNFSFQETIEQSKVETSLQHPLFLVDEATFPNLEDLILGGNYNMKEILRGEFLEECFCKLKYLGVVGYLAVSNWITFLKRLHNLEKLLVEESSWEEIFPYEELFGQEKHARVLTKLRVLKLIQLHMLTHLCKEDTQPSPIFHYLEDLYVSLCGKLKILVPASVSFQNLTNLEILKCHGLINLVTPSTAKSLVQLKKLSVSECESITEVVAGEKGEGNEVITFSQLTYLKLDCLPNLTSFCLRSYSFEFPSLEEVIVSKCPEMKIFCHGILSTPKLERVQATKEDEWHWKVDLNTTVRTLALEGQTMIPLCNSSLE